MRNRLQEDFFFNINADNIFRWMRISLTLEMHIFFPSNISTTSALFTIAQRKA